MDLRSRTNSQFSVALKSLTLAPPFGVTAGTVSITELRNCLRGEAWVFDPARDVETDTPRFARKAGYGTGAGSPVATDPCGSA
jgi:hypothetical protein